MEVKIREVIIIILILIITIFLLINIYVGFLTPGPYGMPTPIIEMEPHEVVSGTIYTVTSYEATKEQNLIDFELIISNISDHSGLFRERVDIIQNNMTGPSFIDINGDNQITVGDYFFIPAGYIADYEEILIFHINNDAPSYWEPIA